MDRRGSAGSLDAGAASKVERNNSRKAHTDCNAGELQAASSNEEDSVGECCATEIRIATTHNTADTTIECGCELGDEESPGHSWPVDSECSSTFYSSTNSRMLYHWEQKVHNCIVSEKNSKRYDDAEYCIDDSGNDDDIDTADCSDEDSYQGSLDICGPVDDVEDMYMTNTSKHLSAVLSKSPDHIIYCDSDGDNGSVSGTRSDSEPWKLPECDEFCRDFRDSIDRIRDRNSKVFDESYEVAESADTDCENSDSFNIEHIDSMTDCHVPVERLVGQCINEMPKTTSTAESIDSSSFMHQECVMQSVPADVAHRLSQLALSSRSMPESRYRSDESDSAVRYPGASTGSPTNLFPSSKRKDWLPTDYIGSASDLGARSYAWPSNVAVDGSSWNRSRRKHFTDGLDSAGNSPKDDDDDSDDEIGATCPDFMCRKDSKNGASSKGDATYKHGHSKEHGVQRNDSLFRSSGMEDRGSGLTRVTVPPSEKHVDDTVTSDARNFMAEFKSSGSQKDEQRLRMMKRRRERRENAAAAGLSQANAVEGYLGDKQYSVDELVSYIDSQPNDPDKNDKKLTGRRKSKKKKKNVHEKPKVRDMGIRECDLTKVGSNVKFDPSSSDSSTASRKETFENMGPVVCAAACTADKTMPIVDSPTGSVETHTKVVVDAARDVKSSQSDNVSNERVSDDCKTLANVDYVHLETINNGSVPQEDVNIVTIELSDMNKPLNVDLCAESHSSIVDDVSGVPPFSSYPACNSNNIECSAILQWTDTVHDQTKTLNCAAGESVGIHSSVDEIVKQTFSCEDVIQSLSMAGTSSPGSSISDARESLDFDCRSLADDSTGVADYEGQPRVSDMDNIVHCLLDDGNFTVVVQKKKKKVANILVHRELVGTKTANNRKVGIQYENSSSNDLMSVKSNKWSSAVPKSKVLQSECNTKLVSCSNSVSFLQNTAHQVSSARVEFKDKKLFVAPEPCEASIPIPSCKIGVETEHERSNSTAMKAVVTENENGIVSRTCVSEPVLSNASQSFIKSHCELGDRKAATVNVTCEPNVGSTMSQILPENCFVVHSLPNQSASGIDPNVINQNQTRNAGYAESEIATTAVSNINSAGLKKNSASLKKVVTSRVSDRVSVFLDTRQPLVPSSGGQPKISFGFVDDTDLLLTSGGSNSVPFSSMQSDNVTGYAAAINPKSSVLSSNDCIDDKHNTQQSNQGNEDIALQEIVSVLPVLPRDVLPDSLMCNDEAERFEPVPKSSLCVVERQAATTVDTARYKLVNSSHSGSKVASLSASSGFNLYNTQQFLFTAFEEALSTKANGTRNGAAGDDRGTKGPGHVVLYADELADAS